MLKFSNFDSTTISGIMRGVNKPRNRKFWKYFCPNFSRIQSQILIACRILQSQRIMLPSYFLSRMTDFPCEQVFGSRVSPIGFCFLLIGFGFNDFFNEGFRYYIQTDRQICTLTVCIRITEVFYDNPCQAKCDHTNQHPGY